MAMWKSVTLSASLLAVATGFAAAAPATVKSDAALRAGPGPTFGVIGHVPGGTRLETTDCRGGWCQVEFNGIAGFVGAADLTTGAAVGSSSAARVENGQRGGTRLTRRPAPAAPAARSAPGGEDKDLYVLPAQQPSAAPTTQR
jgi:uncharacterized protein YraI